MTVGDDNFNQLLDQARGGDMAAFQTLFETQRSLLNGLAYRLVGNSECDDVVMDACLRAWQALPEFKGYTGWTGWLCRITRNSALDELRRRKRRSEELVLSKDDGEHQETVENIMDPRAESPAAAAQNRDLAGILQAAMAELTPEHRAALVMREVDEMSYLDIAAATGVNIGTVMSRLFNARRRLRRIMEEKYHEGV